jgi:hypothetical protein
MTPEQIQATLAAQIEFNRQMQQQTNQNSQAIDRLTERMEQMQQQADADRQQAAEEHQQIRENLAILSMKSLLTLWESPGMPLTG